MADANILSNLTEYAPKALEMVDMDLEHDITSVWKQQVKELKKIAEKLDLNGGDKNNSSTDSLEDFVTTTTTTTTSKSRFPKYGPSCENTEITYAIFEVHTHDREKRKRRPLIPMPPVTPQPMITTVTMVDGNFRYNPVHHRQPNSSVNVEDILEDDDEIANVIKQSTLQNNSADSGSSKIPAPSLRNNEQFINFVEAMLLYEKTCVTSNDEKALTESQVFHAMHEAFSDVGFPYEIRERYTWLRRHERKDDWTGSTIVARNQVLKSYHGRFCRRCLVYNCLLHDGSELVSVQSCLTTPGFGERREPCGPLCYMNFSEDLPMPEEEQEEEQCQEIENTSGYVSMDIPDSSGSCDDDYEYIDDSSSDDSICVVETVIKDNSTLHQKSNGCTEKNAFADCSSPTATGIPDQIKAEENHIDVEKLLFEDTESNRKNTVLGHWTYEEMSVYSAIRTVFPNNFCEMAKTIRTKSCNEVFKLSRQTHLHDVNDRSIPKRRTIKKRKKTPRDSVAKIWFNHCKKYNLIFVRKDEHKPAQQPLYTPCNHPNEPCDPEICVCYRKSIPCEKFCSCIHNESPCENLFPGCQCSGVCNPTSCQCIIALRECDVDFCSCGLDKILSTDDVKDLSCKNISIQMKQRKKVKRDISNVAGWGLFADEPVKKGDLIGEYVGEIISTVESEFRGVRYDQLKYTFLFTKDDANCIDGMHFGNPTRFINSSSNPNCYPLIKSVYGNLRIGLYANRNISPGEELLFDYMNVIKLQMDNNPDTSGTTPKKFATNSGLAPIRTNSQGCDKGEASKSRTYVALKSSM